MQVVSVLMEWVQTASAQTKLVPRVSGRTAWAQMVPVLTKWV